LGQVRACFARFGDDCIGILKPTWSARDREEADRTACDPEELLYRNIIESVLTQVSGAQGGLVSVYQRHEYKGERKRTVMAWGDHVMGLVSVDKPVSNARGLEKSTRLLPRLRLIGTRWRGRLKRRPWQ
jgi:hypothetical protein